MKAILTTVSLRFSAMRWKEAGTAEQPAKRQSNGSDLIVKAEEG